MNLIRNLYLTNRFFWIYGLIVVMFAASFILPFLFPVAQTALVVVTAAFLVDVLLLFNRRLTLNCERNLPKVFSLGDPNTVKINIELFYNMPLWLTIIDEIPEQFERRDFKIDFKLPPRQEKIIEYQITPKSRGEYIFHNINVFLKSSIGLIERRKQYQQEQNLPVYPSIIQMKQFALKAFARTSHYQGIKKMRRIGHSYEFEQIKNYVRGDDYRSINWKATSRRGQLMVNQYEDERAQQVYAIIDKSRPMKMPFNGMSLLDYAINTSLVISNISLKKNDRAGLLTFSDKIGTTIKADRTTNQLNKILNALYNEKERHLEANYELLYRTVRRMIQGRSLLFLFTNFESSYAAERVLPILRRLNVLHLLVVVFFENTEVNDYTRSDAQNIEQIYYQTIAQQFMSEKEQIAQMLRQYGIQAIITRPEELSLNTINKYLELKSRGLI